MHVHNSHLFLAKISADLRSNPILANSDQMLVSRLCGALAWGAVGGWALPRAFDLG